MKGFSAVETIGIGIPNPRSVIRVPIPEDLAPEVRARIEKALDELEGNWWCKGIGMEYSTPASWSPTSLRGSRHSEGLEPRGASPELPVG